MNDFAKLNLKKNPFENITPSLEEYNRGHLIWAGMPKLKKQLEEVHQKALFASAHQIILNWGSWGAGKTFAAFYFNEKQLQKRFSEFEGEIFHVYVRLPKDGGVAAKQFFRDVLDYLNLSSVRQRIRSILLTINEDEFYRFLSQRIRSEEFAKAIIKLADPDNDVSDMMSRYLYVGSTKTELKKLGLSRALSTDIDHIKILTGILLCFVAVPKSKAGKIFLWIDEMEDLIYYNSKQYRAFSQIMRDLFDQMSEGLTVFMNFTLAEPEEETVKLLLGEALWSRITQKIRFRELSVEEGMLYCKELLGYSQISKDNEYSPFTESSLRSLLAIVPPANMTPREINKVCTEVLNFARTLNISKISDETVHQWISQSTVYEE